MDEQARKRAKTASAGKDEPKSAETLVVRFRAVGDGDAEEKTSSPLAAPAQLDIPVDVTVVQLERIVNKILDNTEKTPYAFYIDAPGKDGGVAETEVIGSLKETLAAAQVGTEALLEIKYQQLSLFRVRPVSRCTDSLPGHTEAILHVSFSPDGWRLASGGGDTTVRFWDVSTRTPRSVCRGHKHHVLCTSWAPDGKRFASADKTGCIRLWDPDKGAAVGKPLVGHKQWVTFLSWEPQHRRPSCERLASSSKDATTKIWNARTGRCIMTLTGHGASVECVKWGGEGLLYTASRDKTIMVWAEREEDGVATAHPFKLIRVLKGHGHRVNALALSTDYLCRTGAFDHTGSLAKGQPGDKAAMQNAASVRYNEAKKSFGSGGIPFERLVSCSDDFTLYFWHPTIDKQPKQRLLGHQQPVTHLSFSPNGRYLASASFDRKVKVWCGRTGKFLLTCTGHVAHVYQVCWSPDSRLIASASKDSTIKVWEIQNGGKATETLSGHLDEIYGLDWSPNGALLASGGKDRLLKIWTS